MPKVEAAPQPHWLKLDDLDGYVKTIDSFGGLGTPGAIEFISRVGYRPTVQVDVTLDPFSAEYLDQQLALYSEIAGRTLDQLKNEDTPFDIEVHVPACNSYNHGIPVILAEHWLRLGTALRFAAPRAGEWLLDMGCGWGLSSEFMAQSGLKVLAMDVNANFVELVNRRAARLGLNITATQGEFEIYGPPHPVDLIFFYECLHHAPRPWLVLARLATALSRHQTSQVLMAGEPIQHHWWPHWGLRMDAASIYVMRKHGWFESGWSLAFIQRCLASAGLEPRVTETMGLGEVIAANNGTGPGLSWLQHLATVDGFSAGDGTASTMAPSASVRFGSLPYDATFALRLARPTPGPVVVQVDGVRREAVSAEGRFELGVVRTNSVVKLQSPAPLALSAFEWTCHFQ